MHLEHLISEAARMEQELLPDEGQNVNTEASAALLVMGGQCSENQFDDYSRGMGHTIAWRWRWKMIWFAAFVFGYALLQYFARRALLRRGCCGPSQCLGSLR
jgi:hypothetical protein